MKRRLVGFVLLSCLAVPAAFAARAFFESSFLGAPAGVPAAFEAVTLPPVTASGTTTSPAPALQVFRTAFGAESAFAPPLAQLLQGDTVITSDAQMHEVWTRLFAVPYDASAFDFDSTFVVLMGGGALANGTFGISSVETVDASYADPGTPGGPSTDRFLSVTATTFLNGVQPADPPSPEQVLSAVKIDRALPADIVFHRTTILGI